MIHFVIYEAVKASLATYRIPTIDDRKTLRDFLEFMAAGSFSKTIASSIAYPHGKVVLENISLTEKKINESMERKFPFPVSVTIYFGSIANDAEIGSGSRTKRGHASL